MIQQVCGTQSSTEIKKTAVDKGNQVKIELAWYGGCLADT